MKKSSSFSGSLGFVLAAAGSAVGVGNIWRFPYLCAKDGGGLFLLVYLVLVLTFGFTLLTTDVAIGRRTKQNALNAFATLNKKWKFLGYLTFLVPTGAACWILEQLPSGRSTIRLCRRKNSTTCTVIILARASVMHGQQARSISWQNILPDWIS